VQVDGVEPAVQLAISITVDSERLALTERLSALVETLAEDVDTSLQHRHTLTATGFISPAIRVSVRLVAFDPIRMDNEDCIVIQAPIILTGLPHRI
jgi:hypothetical protein